MTLDDAWRQTLSRYSDYEVTAVEDAEKELTIRERTA